MVKSSRHVCSSCNNSFATRKSLWNHKQRCRSLQYDEQKENDQILGGIDSADKSKNTKVQNLTNENDDEIPTFDGNEFTRKKPVSRETLYQIMKMLKIPIECWDIG